MGFLNEPRLYWSLILSKSWLTIMCLMGMYQDAIPVLTKPFEGLHTRLFRKYYSIGMWLVPINYLARQWLHPTILVYTCSLAVLLTWLIKQRIGIPRYRQSVLDRAYTAEEYPIQLVHIDKYLHSIYTIVTKCPYTAYTRLKY